MAEDARLASGLKQRNADRVGAQVTKPLSLAERLDFLEDDGRDHADTRRTHDLLARAINRDVLPRLLLARHGKLAAAVPTPLAVAGVEQLVEIAMTHQTPETLAFVERQQAAGLALDAVYLDLLAPAARLLGRLWEDDRVDFGLVTIATDRLRQVMRSLSRAHQDTTCLRQATHRALLVPGPGDQHSFGLAMVAEFFGRAGWHVWSGVPDSPAQLVEMVRRDWYAVVGFSVGSGLRLDALIEAIRKVRRLSRNRNIGVMVGGPVFQERPELVALVGADATASDGRQAVLQAHKLLDLASSQA